MTRRSVARPDFDELTQQIMLMQPTVAVVNNGEGGRECGSDGDSTDSA